MAPEHAMCGPTARATWKRNRANKSLHNGILEDPFAAAACFTEEHDGSAPLEDYIDHETASYAAEAISLLGARTDRRPPKAAAFAAATAAALKVKSKSKDLKNDTRIDAEVFRAGASAFAAAHLSSRNDSAATAEKPLPLPWFLAVGFVRPHLPMVCPKRFWDSTSDPYSEADNSELLPSLGEGASFALRRTTQTTESGLGSFVIFYRGL